MGEIERDHKSVAHLDHHVDYQYSNLGVPHFSEHAREIICIDRYWDKRLLFLGRDVSATKAFLSLENLAKHTPAMLRAC